MFLGGEVEEERAVCNAGGSHYCPDIGGGYPCSFELGDGGTHQAFPCLQALGLARRRAVHHCQFPMTASAIGVSPEITSKVRPTVLGASSTASNTAATSS